MTGSKYFMIGVLVFAIGGGVAFANAMVAHREQGVKEGWLVKDLPAKATSISDSMGNQTVVLEDGSIWERTGHQGYWKRISGGK